MLAILAFTSKSSEQSQAKYALSISF